MAVTVEEMVYAPGLCVERHAHDTHSLIYIISGPHWSGYSRGADICHPRTVRFLPAGEPHENYFPVRSRCLQIEWSQPVETACSPGEISIPSAPALGARLHREFRQRDDVSLLGIEATVLELLQADARDERRVSPRLRSPADSTIRAISRPRSVDWPGCPRVSG